MWQMGKSENPVENTENRNAIHSTPFNSPSPFRCAYSSVSRRAQAADLRPGEAQGHTYGVGRTGVGITKGVSVGEGVAVPSRVGSGVAVG